MEDKKIEDRFANLNNQIIRLEKMMDEEKIKIKKIDEIQEQLTSLTKNLNICIGLLARAMKGPNTQNIFNDMYDNNRSIYNNLTNELDEQIGLSEKNINKLIEEKDNLIEETKNEIKKITEEKEQKEE